MSDPDDVCGAECVDGTPCQNPAESCSIPSHSDPDAENPDGRPSKFDTEREQAVIEAAQQGKSKAGCARAAGVGEATLQRWLDAHDEFRSAFARARAKGESELIDGGLYNPDVDSSFAKFMLASSFDYKKTERVEADVDQTTTHELGDDERDLALEAIRELQTREADNA